MAVPAYTTDLTTVDLADVTTNWDESSNSIWDDGGPPTQETDYYIHDGTGGVTPACISATASVAKGNHSTLIVNNGSGITVPTDGAILIWAYFAAPNALDSYANGGLKMLAGSSFGDFYYWNIGGNDFGRNPYGGWENYAVDPSFSVDGTVGSPSGTVQYMGIAHKITAAISKGNPFGVDVVRYGRCEARFANGSTSDGYCTFSGFAATNDAISARWGLIQAIPGGLLCKGLMTIGYGAAADFRDSNIKLFFDDVRKVSDNFNRIEVVTSGTKLYLTNVSMEALGTVSKGRFEMMEPGLDVRWDSCQFVSMDSFGFLSEAQITDTIFRGCDLVVASGNTMTGSSILSSVVPSGTGALYWNVSGNPDGYLDNMNFSKGLTAHHALELGASSGDTITLRGWTATGFNASNNEVDSTIYVARPTGTVTINVIEGVGNFSYRTDGATVSIVVSPVTTQVTVKDPDGNEVQNARVLLEASDATGDLPYNATVTIVRSGSTATVTHNSHGLNNGDKVVIRYADQQAYNGVKTISNVTTNTYDYTVTGTPDSPATGTIKSSGVVLHDLTNASGVATASRSFSVNQPVKGFARKSASPRYKDIEITDTVNKDSGLTVERRFTLDE